jgi:hypothetical protein
MSDKTKYMTDRISYTITATADKYIYVVDDYGGKKIYSPQPMKNTAIWPLTATPPEPATVYIYYANTQKELDELTAPSKTVTTVTNGYNINIP